jgi:TonB family protein
MVLIWGSDLEAGQQFGTARAPDWKQWEGSVVHDAFPARRCLSGTGPNSVFLTEFEGQDAAIKLIPAAGGSAESCLARWRSVANLSHPHLARLLHFDRCELDGLDLVYVVTEWAAESLAEVVPARPLTPGEAREFLEPALSVLGYLHREGFAHGRLKPEKILAVQDQLKIASDDVGRIADPASASGPSPSADIEALGTVVCQVLTQRPPDPSAIQHLPEPFRTIVRRSRRGVPEGQWSISQIEAWLRNPAPASPPVRATSQRWRYGAAAGAVAAIALAWGLTHHAATPIPATPPAAAQPALPKSDPPAAVNPPAQAAAAPKILQEVLPQIPAQARNTIQGKVTMTIKVNVDPSGDVTDAKLESPGSSRYFAGFTMAAARRWKFQPTSSPQQWSLKFELYRSDTKVSSKLVSPAGR